MNRFLGAVIALLTAVLISLPSFYVCEHEDLDQNHACDYCEEILGTCEDADRNHICEYCGAIMGTCADANYDHLCDYGCEKVHGNHVDENYDHACDYGCSKSIGMHEDTDFDHNCNYCGTETSRCSDADLDHSCDVCGAEMGICEDWNFDHLCDYGCEKIYGEHTDIDFDHICEYGCEEPIGAHADVNSNHFCDYCGSEMSVCMDYDLSHACDICDVAMGICADETHDHYCDYGCGAMYGDHLDSDFDHACDYGCGDEIGAHEDADKNHVCEYCGWSIGTCDDFDFDHYCDYGCGVYRGEHRDGDRNHACDYGCNERIGECVDGDGDVYCDYGCGRCFAFTRCDKDGTENESGEYILFGEYPQSLKADSVTVTDAQDSRGYFLGDDGCYYAKVTADPNSFGYKFSNATLITDGTVYYFKVEPIRWRILTEDGENAFILCDSIVDNRRYDKNDNDYKESEIRNWLNETFYTTAFDSLQRELILITTVDNSVASTGYVSNPYVCEDTEDKIFLLSYAETLNSFYGFVGNASVGDAERRLLTSDYTRAKGAWMSTESGSYGIGLWDLRSPGNNYSDSVRYVTSDGEVSNSYGFADTSGIVPALWIRLWF